MPLQYQVTIADQRGLGPRLRWLTLEAPELARAARAGQYVLVRCAEQGSYDPLLRRPLFLGASEPAIGQVGLLYEPADRGLAWLARGRAGDVLDVIGPFGHSFTIDSKTRNLLLIGQGGGQSALLLLAQEAVRRGCAVTLLIGADDPGGLAPPFLLPGEVEYQSIVGTATDLLAQPAADDQRQQAKNRGSARAAREDSTPSGAASSQPLAASPIIWADQVCAALPAGQLAPLREAIRAVKYRWERGFASVLLEGPLVCGVGACGVCTINLRPGPRTVCHDGPVFDLRDVG